MARLMLRRAGILSAMETYHVENVTLFQFCLRWDAMKDDFINGRERFVLVHCFCMSVLLRAQHSLLFWDLPVQRVPKT